MYDEKCTFIEEGFVGGTLVKTPQGYTPIDQLQVGDTIIAYDEHLGYTRRIVLNIFRYNVQHYIRLYIDNVFCEMGSHQKFYDNENNTWIRAEQLKSGDQLSSNFNVIKFELIKEETVLYAITVENHTFCITEKDIIAHNLEPISSGLAITAIAITGAVVNPIGVTIAGAIMTAVGVGVFAYKLWHGLFVKKTNHFNQEKNLPIIHTDSQEDNEQISQNLESNGASGNYPPEDPDDDDEKIDKEEIKFPENESMLKHIFRPSKGHFPIDSPVNRNHLLDLVMDKRNFIGICERGHEWYVKILENGKQLWAVVRNNIIRNGGINETPRTFNGTTGLSRLLPGK